MTEGVRTVLIAGPTASGKSALALRLAARWGGVIVNADSMQVYSDLRVLTARPSAAEEAQAPHRLYGVLDGAQRCSAGAYAALARETLETLARAGKRAILVGGTGLYFRALTEGLSPMPAIAPSVKAQAADLLSESGAAGLHAWLLERDPQSAAGVRPSDPQRLLRAAELLLATGEGLAAWQARPGQPVLAGAPVQVVLSAPRAWLHARAEARFAAMLAAGAVAEVEALRARALDPGLPVMKAVGVPELSAYLDGALDLESAGSRAAIATRQFIKRQETWFRNQMGAWARVPADDPDSALAALEKMLSVH